jgi:hypothetical protein
MHCESNLQYEAAIVEQQCCARVAVVIVDTSRVCNSSPSRKITGLGVAWQGEISELLAACALQRRSREKVSGSVDWQWSYW